MDGKSDKPNVQLIRIFVIFLMVQLSFYNTTYGGERYNKMENIPKAFNNSSFHPLFVLKDFSTITVSGTVKDTTGTPIPSVNIRVKDGDAGTTTDFDGHFQIKTNDDATLIFSSLGFANKEVQVKGRAVINITLEYSSSKLDEVVVVGYGTQKKVNLTGAVSEVNSEALENRPLTDLGAGLQGKVPNLNITTGNAPGQGSSFNIRGYTSINGGKPLVLVDGVEQDPNLINPNDVEKVSVLKDAASTAIYGSRAAYGVILITTKSGKKNTSPQVRISSSYAVTDQTIQPKYVNSMDYINYMNLANHNSGSGDYFDDRVQQGAEKYFNDPENNDPVLYDPAIDKDGKYIYVGNTDWESALYGTGSMQQNNFSISGGSESTSYFLSYGNSMQKGFLESYDDSYQRHNVNLKLSSDLSDWLTVGGQVRYTYAKGDHPSGGAGGNSGITATSGELKNDLKPLMPVRHPDGNYSGQGQFTNPFAVGAEGGHNQTKKNDLWLTARVGVKPLKDLNIKIDYTFNPYSSNNEFTSRLFEEYHADGSTNIYPWTNPNLIRLENYNDYYHVFNATADYTKNLNNHNFKLLIGYNQELKKTKSFLSERENLIDNDLPVINGASGEKTVDGAKSSWAVLGTFFRLNYNYKERYLLEINGRYDGSSKFPKHDRFVFSPSVSAGWRVSEEDFWDENKPVFDLINEFKIRGSFGTQGNQYVGSNFPYVSKYVVNTSLPYLLGSSSSLPVSVAPGGLVSPSFTWEKTRQWNIGADLELFEHRLTLGLDYYTRYTKGMLAQGAPLPAVLGTGVPRVNAADLKTEGWELSINWKDRINKNFSHHASLVLSNSNAYIEKFKNPSKIITDYYPGYHIGQIWGFETNGLFQSEEEIKNGPDQSELYSGKWNPGDVEYVDQDGDNKITNGDNTVSDHGDLKKIGNSEPHYQIGINYGITWKNFDVNLFFQGVLKRDFVPGDRFYGINSQWDVPMRETLDYWTADNPDAYLPKPYIDGGHGNRGGLGGTPDRYLQDGSYLRLKQATIGYNFKGDWLNKVRVSNLKVYFTGQNLLTFTSLSKLYDPENLDLMGYPVTKSFSVGINITLK